MGNLKFVIASDLHGSMIALEKVMEIVTERRADRLILLGDIFGSNGNAMVERLNTIAYKVVCIKGNNDWYFEPKNADFKIFEKMYYDINSKLAYLCHGHQLRWMDLSMYAAKIIMFGHFHYPILKRDKDIILLCPGSPAYPRNSSHKSYAYIEDNHISICTLDGKVLQSLDF